VGGIRSWGIGELAHWSQIWGRKKGCLEGQWELYTFEKCSNSRMGGLKATMKGWEALEGPSQNLPLEKVFFFQDLLREKPSSLFHVVGMELNICSFPEDLVHMCGYLGQDTAGL
jgi:hypothetical protein